MTSAPRRSLEAAGIAALLLGLLATPWVYATVFVALSSFSSPVAVVLPLLLLGATLELGLEAFARLQGPVWLRGLGAALSIGIVLTSLWVLSRFTLLSPTGRLGLFAATWLGSTLVWLVGSLATGALGPELRLRSRLNSPLRRGAALVAALLVFGTLAVLAWGYLSAPVEFIGGPTSPRPIG